MSATILKSKIMSVELVKKDADNAIPAVIPDLDPDTVRIDQRPEGTLSSETNKLVYFTQDGRKTMYLSLSYMTVDGVLDGKSISVERPIEIFVPASQTEEDHQWESAFARTVSYGFRQGGDVGKMLKDLTHVTWSKGPVRCGVNQHGKPRYHNSVVAMAAWGYLEMLRTRGILGDDYNMIPAKDRLNADCSVSKSTTPAPVVDSEMTHQPSAGVCPTCEGSLRHEGGCLVCNSCDWSKCS